MTAVGMAGLRVVEHTISSTVCVCSVATGTRTLYNVLMWRVWKFGTHMWGLLWQCI